MRLLSLSLYPKTPSRLSTHRNANADALAGAPALRLPLHDSYSSGTVTSFRPSLPVCGTAEEKAAIRKKKGQ